LGATGLSDPPERETSAIVKPQDPVAIALGPNAAPVYYVHKAP